MPEPDPSILSTLHTIVAQLSAASYTPYSHHPVASAVLLSDGTWVPGVRVENASFSLVIPSLLNAVTTAFASGRRDIVGAVQSEPFSEADLAYIKGGFGGEMKRVAAEVVMQAKGPLPLRVEDRLDPFLPDPPPKTPEQGIALARAVASLAYTPESAFPVGCVLVLEDGRMIPGVNVEHPDWPRILCAERNALGTACSYACLLPQTLYLTCPLDDHGSPCGACRQILTELSPTLALWMDRGPRPPEKTTPALLLPGFFEGGSLRRRA